MDGDDLPKVLLIDSLVPMSAYVTGSVCGPSLVTGVTMRAVSSDDDVEKDDSTAVVSDTAAILEGNGLLDSIGYGLPLLIQQYKANINKRWKKVELLLSKKRTIKSSKLFQNEDLNDFADSKSNKRTENKYCKQAKQSYKESKYDSDLDSKDISTISSSASTLIDDSKNEVFFNNCSEKTESNVSQYNLFTAFAKWRYIIKCCSKK